MLIFNSNQLNSLQEIFITVLILHPTLIFLAFRAYLLEPPPQDYISKGKTIEKSQNSNEVKMFVLVLGYVRVHYSWYGLPSLVWSMVTLWPVLLIFSLLAPGNKSVFSPKWKILISAVFAYRTCAVITRGL